MGVIWQTGGGSMRGVHESGGEKSESGLVSQAATGSSTCSWKVAPNVRQPRHVNTGSQFSRTPCFGPYGIHVGKA